MNGSPISTKAQDKLRRTQGLSALGTSRPLFSLLPGASPFASSVPHKLTRDSRVFITKLESYELRRVHLFV
ncbi:hypothetical protein BDW69DRAFT_121798 [Aspergillus filifer]